MNDSSEHPHVSDAELQYRLKPECVFERLNLSLDQAANQLVAADRIVQSLERKANANQSKF